MVRIVKGLLGGLCLFVLAFVILSTFSSEPSSSREALHSLVSQTHHQLNQLHKLKEELEGDSPPDNSILIDLGFVDHPLVYPFQEWKNVSSPAIVSAVSSETLHMVSRLIKTAQNLSSSSTLILYELALNDEEMKQIEMECNSSCEVLQFDFDKYPSHIRDLRLQAYRPIIIQEMLQRIPEIMWLNPCMKISHWETKVSLKTIQKQAMFKGGVVSWPLTNPYKLPTTALTHPDMFPVFRTKKHDYDFQKMSDPSAVYIVNKRDIHDNLMKPWVNCALTSNCLSPIGAQDTGCKFNKKPRFRYSGCHMYDTSAFNVALGLAFGVDNTTYIEEPAIFECSDVLEEEDYKLASDSNAVSYTSILRHNHFQRTKRSPLRLYFPQNNFKPISYWSFINLR